MVDKSAQYRIGIFSKLSGRYHWPWWAIIRRQSKEDLWTFDSSFWPTITWITVQLKDHRMKQPLNITGKAVCYGAKWSKIMVMSSASIQIAVIRHLLQLTTAPMYWIMAVFCCYLLFYPIVADYGYYNKYMLVQPISYILCIQMAPNSTRWCCSQ